MEHQQGSTPSAVVPRQFAFEGVELKEACWLDGKPYFTRKAIGIWLEYAYPQEAIDKIIERNPHIKDSRWSSQVKLTCELPTGKGNDRSYERKAVTVKLRATDGKEYETEVYNPVGLQLIIFESSQPKARGYKIWAANLVHAFMTGQLKEPPRKTVTFQQVAMMPDGQEREDWLWTFALKRQFKTRGGVVRTLSYPTVKRRANELRSAVIIRVPWVSTTWPS